MRRVIVPQKKLDELTIAEIKLDPKSRDYIPLILRGLQRLYTTPEDESKEQQKEQEIKDAHRAYLDLAEGYLTQADHTRQQVGPHDPLSVAWLSALNDFMEHGRRQIDQIDRRVLRGDHIP